MTTALKVRDNLLTAELTYTTEVRASAPADGQDGAREFEGLGVPYNVVVDLGWGDYEAFDPGSVELAEQIPLVLWQHKREIPIGVIIPERCAETPEGYRITGRLSTTAAANDAYTLLGDGVITRLSIGFQPIEYRVDEEGVIHWTRVLAREWSLVTFPAYDDAVIDTVRSAPALPNGTPTTNKENTMTDTDTRGLDALRAELTDLNRAIDQLRAGITPPAAQPDRRSAGAILKALAAGDEATVRAYEATLAAAGIGAQRAFDGGVLADTITKDAWIGDLTRVFDSASGVLASFFNRDTLPATGMNLEFAELDFNTLTVTKQAAEGDPIPMGKVGIKTRTAPVSTYAGGGSLSRQTIERSTINLLNTTLKGLSIAAGARKKANLRDTYSNVVNTRQNLADDAGVVPLGATLAASTASKWERMLVKAAIRFSKMALSLDGMLVSENVFGRLIDLTVDGERVFVTDDGNHSGTLNLPGLTGRLASLPIALDPDQAGDQAVFANKMAITAYDSAVASLTDEAILTLTKDFAVYMYGAVADEIPAAIVPVKFA